MHTLAILSLKELAVNSIDATHTGLSQQADREVQCLEFKLNETLKSRISGLKLSLYNAYHLLILFERKRVTLSTYLSLCVEKDWL